MNRVLILMLLYVDLFGFDSRIGENDYISQTPQMQQAIKQHLIDQCIKQGLSSCKYRVEEFLEIRINLEIKRAIKRSLI
jgi:hypothetical protein